MNMKSIFVLGLVLSQLAVGKSFAKDSVTQIILSEVVESASSVQKVVDKLTSKMKQMTDQDGNPINLQKISVQQCFFEVRANVYGQLDKDPEINSEVFVVYHSKYGKDFQAKFCSHGGFGGGLYNLNSSDGLGNF